MLELGTSALAHANWHANYHSFENHMWSQLSVLQAAHAAEILIKARIAQEHPLLIFEHVPKSTQVQHDELELQHLFEKAKTIQYGDLPERLWASTSLKIKNVDTFKKFGYLRNSIQHFASPRGIDCSKETIKFIYEVIDPFINECWGLYAIDFNEDHEPYTYLIEGLIQQEIMFLVSKEACEHLQYVTFNWPEDSEYKTLMKKRFHTMGFDINNI